LQYFICYPYKNKILSCGYADIFAYTKQNTALTVVAYAILPHKMAPLLPIPHKYAMLLSLATRNQIYFRVVASGDMKICQLDMHVI
jgi:hypothetical protein